MKKKKVTNKVEYKNLPKGINGEAYNSGRIVINKNLSPVQQKIALSHEKVHRQQIKEGRLWYDADYVYWNGKKYSRKNMKEGAKHYGWEAEAYKKQIKKA